MNFKFLNPLLLVLSSALAGCSSVVRVPSTKFYTPEVTGTPTTGRSIGFAFEAGMDGTQNWVLSPDIAYYAINTNSTQIDSGQSPRFAGSASLPHNFEIKLILPTHLEAKFQWLGNSRVNAREGNLSAAVVAAAGRASSKRNASQFWGGFAREVELNEAFFQVSAPLGYRPLDVILIYVTPSYFYETLSGTEKTFTGATNITLKSASSESTFSAHLTSVGLSAGLGFDVGVPDGNMGRPVQLLAECGLQSFKLPASHATDHHCGFLGRLIF